MQHATAPRPQALAALAIGAAAVTVALTAAAFWLSYEHLHDIADANGLDGARAWAWPATVDLFIIAGELLILRASLRGTVDRWAIALAASGSLGSIALNVAGVGTHARPLEYVVAAVPPVAALLAFGALMRQVHDALARAAEQPLEAAVIDTPPAVAEQADTPLEVTAPTVVEVTSEQPLEVTTPTTVEAAVVDTAPHASPLVICGAGQVHEATMPAADTAAEVTAEQPLEVTDDQTDRLSTEAARIVLESCWAKGTPPAEAARLATRSVSYVKKVYARLDETRGPAPVPGQLALVAGGDAR